MDEQLDRNGWILFLNPDGWLVCFFRPSLFFPFPLRSIDPARPSSSYKKKEHSYCFQEEDLVLFKKKKEEEG